MLRVQNVLLLALALPWLMASAADRGVVLELDRDRYTLSARDVAHDIVGPTLRVVLGSPGHPTPPGEYPIHEVVFNPGWYPGDFARAQGARALPPSKAGPLGVGKIPFAADGRIAVHGGAQELLLGKPVSLGCVRTVDEDFLAVVAWLDERGALAPGETRGGGEFHRAFRRPARVIVR